MPVTKPHAIAEDPGVSKLDATGPALVNVRYYDVTAFRGDPLGQLLAERFKDSAPFRLTRETGESYTVIVWEATPGEMPGSAVFRLIEVQRPAREDLMGVVIDPALPKPAGA